MDFNSKYKSSEIETLLDKVKNFEGGGGKTAVVYHGTEDTELELAPNVVHKWDSIDSLSLTLPEDEDGYVNQYKVVFMSASDAFTMAVPSSLRWVNDEIPSFEANMQYEVSIEGKKILWAKFKAEMPVGELLEYIENDGADYIMTDYVLSSKDCGYAFQTMVLSEGSKYTHLFGAATGSTVATSPLGAYVGPSDNYIIGVWDGTTENVHTSQALNVVHTVEVEKTPLTMTCQYPLYVFARNEGGKVESTRISHARIYYLKVLDSKGNANLDLRPFRRASDGAIGLVDLVSGSFYPSVNGNLIGEPFFPAGDYLEYIENDGTDYIVTDYIPSNKDYGVSFECVPLFAPSSTYYVAFGARTGDTAAETAVMAHYYSKYRLDWGGVKGTTYDYSNGVTTGLSITNTQNNMPTTYPLVVFGGMQSGNVTYVGKFRICHIVIYGEDGNQRLALRPFRRASDNAVGLLDDVSGKFYTSVNGDLTGA